MYFLCHNIGVPPDTRPQVRANYNTREQIAGCKGILTFDGVYKNVYENRDVLSGKQFTLFVTGNYIGLDNTFDTGMPIERYCTIKEIESIGGEIGWHTWSHRDLTTLTESEILQEVTPPEWMSTNLFAYPYGRYNDLVLDIVSSMYEKAFSVINTDGTEMTIPRSYL